MNLSIHKINNVSEVLPLYEKDPERFMRFYNAVYILLSEIPEGKVLRITEHCKPTSYSLFVKCACLCIIEEQNQRDINDAILEFNDDYTEIRRSIKFVKKVIQSNFYSPRKK